MAWLTKVPLQKKAIGLVLSVLTTSLLVMAAATIFQTATVIENTQKKSASGIAAALAYACELSLVAGDTTELNNLARAFLDTLPDEILFIAVYDRDQKMVAQRERDLNAWLEYQANGVLTTKLMVREHLVEERQTREDRSRLPKSLGDGLGGNLGNGPNSIEDRVTPLDRSTLSAPPEYLGRVVVGLSKKPVERSKFTQAGATLTVMLVTAIVSTILIMHKVGSWARRLDKLIEASELISHGDFSHPLSDVASDEIGRLTNSYERMRHAVKTRDYDLRVLNEKLQDQVTDRTRDLERTKNVAVAANQAKSQFLANMSHEMRTPLNGVIGMVNLLQGTRLNEQQRQYAGIVRSSANQLLDLINDILDLSKIEAEKMDLETVDFHPAFEVEEIVESFAQKVENRGIELASFIDPNLPTDAMGDPSRIKQILNNLIGNAIKFTERGGVGIRVMHMETREGWIHLRFEVRDTGIGIPSDRLDRLFKSFSQVDTSTTKKYGGTGLGLAISKRLVEMMQGEIGVESTDGRGSTFWFILKVKQSHSPIAKAYQKPPTDQFQHLRVMLVDDNDITRDTLAKQLISWGAKVESLSSGPMVIDRLRQAIRADKPFQLVLIDEKMPNMDGFQIAAAIKSDEHLRSLRLVLLNSIGTRHVADYLSSKGFSASITKPVRQSTLQRTVQGVMSPAGTATSAPSHVLYAPASTTSANDPVSTTETAPQSLVGPEGDSSEEHYDDEPKEIIERAGRVLLAEDNETNQMVAGELLRLNSVEFEIVGNGQLAVDALRAAGLGQFSLVLMDCMMPELDGISATKELRRLEHEGRLPGSTADRLPIVALTAQAVKGDREECLSAGMNDYITKPIDGMRLKKCLDKYVPVVRVTPIEPTPSTPTAEPAAPASPVTPATSVPTAPVVPTTGSVPSSPDAVATRSMSEALAPQAPATPSVTLQPSVQTPAPADSTAQPDGGESDLPVLDRASLLQRCMNNEPLANRVLSKFSERVEGDVAKLKELLDGDQLEAAVRQAHSIKGAAGNVSAEALRSIAADIEAALRHGDSQDVVEALPKLQVQVVRFMNELQASG